MKVPWLALGKHRIPHASDVILKDISNIHWCRNTKKNALYAHFPGWVLLEIRYTIRCRYNVVIFFKHSHKIHPIGRPFGARYGVPFMCLNSDLYLLSVAVVTYAISCYIGPRYNGTLLYFECLINAWKLSTFEFALEVLNDSHAVAYHFLLQNICLYTIFL